MCCGQRSNPNPAVSQPSVSWIVKDPAGNQIYIKTSEVAAKLAAARIGGTVEKRVSGGS